MVNLGPMRFNKAVNRCIRPAFWIFAVQSGASRYAGAKSTGGTMKMATAISILLLAAGASRRMRGADKLLEPVGGQALLRHVASVALAVGPVTVTLGGPARAAALAGLNVQIVQVTGDGMAASLRAGVAVLPANQAVLVLLADMPEVDADDLRALIAAYLTAPDDIHRAVTAAGKPGHPVIFPPWARDDLLMLCGDSGAKPLLATYAARVRPVVLPDNHATTDLDTPEDWAAWRAAQKPAP